MKYFKVIEKNVTKNGMVIPLTPVLPEGVEFIRKRLIKLGVIIQSHELVTV